ncbi:MAG: flavodoxin family protein [Desulfovibrio sp.]|nr:flavodoxin family protein [Desulfovibrio sp.]
MPQNVLIISSSPRINSNSDALAEAFAEGARSAGHRVEKISLRDKTINFCKGCLACQKTHRCIQHDDADAIAQKMLLANVLCFATPVYYYAVCGQMKTMLDRANPLFSANYAFRKVYLLATAADDAPSAMDGVLKDMEGWVACFPECRIAGMVRGTGVTNAGDIKNNIVVLQESYELGHNC